jgi:Holliday junction resolvase RusA-like endonuclease
VTTLPLTVHLPGPVVGWARARLGRGKGGKPKHFTDPQTASAELRVGWALANAWQLPPIDTAIWVQITVEVAVPDSKSKKFRAEALANIIKPIGKPDLDNIAKLIGDGGNGVIWKDDSRICDLGISRRYSETPGLTITVRHA